MSKCRHHYEWYNGKLKCGRCGHRKWLTRSVKRKITVALIGIVVLVAGFLVFQNLALITNNANHTQEILVKQIPNLTTQISTPLRIAVPKIINTVGNFSNSITQTVKTPSLTESNNATAEIINQDPEHAINSITYPSNNNEQPVIKIDQLEQKIHLLINEQRQANGKSPLIFDPQLTLIARTHSQDMVTRNYFEHETPENLSFNDRYKQAGYDCQRQFDVTSSGYMISEGGENIFQNNLYNSVDYTNGYPTHYDWNDMDSIASSTVDGWMHSEGHRTNILYSVFQNEGIGVAISNDSKVYITENFC